MNGTYTFPLIYRIMPTYTYFCKSCTSSFDLFSSIRDYQEKEKCPDCNEICCRNYHEDMLTLNSCVKKSDSELATIGDIANRNRDRLSDDEKVALHHKHNSYKEGFSQTDLTKGMSRMKKPKQKIKWTKD